MEGIHLSYFLILCNRYSSASEEHVLVTEVFRTKASLLQGTSTYNTTQNNCS